MSAKYIAFLLLLKSVEYCFKRKEINAASDFSLLSNLFKLCPIALADAGRAQLQLALLHVGALCQLRG